MSVPAKKAKLSSAATGTVPTIPTVYPATTLQEANADCVIFIASFAESTGHKVIDDAFERAKQLDAAAGVLPTLVADPSVSGKRIILMSCGPLTHDADDVRMIGDAAAAAIKRAMQAGSRAPILAVHVPSSAADPELHENALQVAALAALAAVHVPLQVREDSAAPTAVTQTLESLYVHGIDAKGVDAVSAIELGRAVARDICGGDPERMAPRNVATYIEQVFAGSPIKVEVQHDNILQDFPLLHAVGRCSEQVERHKPCVVSLSYSEGSAAESLFLVGKGVTYDTGGADVKAGGHMAGMHRDKGGAAAIAGLFRTIMHLKPKGVRFEGRLALVRNSIGADAYVADEIIRSRAGVRVRVGNTDAEGRMAMADVLCKAKEDALSAVKPRLFTVATLTGHAVRAVGIYSAIMDNGPARKDNTSSSIADAGLKWADPCEISTLRREDYAFIRSKYVTEDVLQCNNEPSSATPRGHQFPGAFLAVVSGVDAHGIVADKSLPYTHMDIAGSTRMWPEPVSGAPIPAMTARFVLPRL